MIRAPQGAPSSDGSLCIALWDRAIHDLHLAPIWDNRPSILVPIVYPYAMSAVANRSTGKWSGFLASVWMQIRAGVVVGLPADGEPDSDAVCGVSVGEQSTRRVIRSLDDYAGRQTSNGLGSLDIGAGRSRIDE